MNGYGHYMKCKSFLINLIGLGQHQLWIMMHFGDFVNALHVANMR